MSPFLLWGGAINDSKKEAGFWIEVSRISFPHLWGGVIMDHEYEAVFRMGRIRSFFFFSGGGGGE